MVDAGSDDDQVDPITTISVMYIARPIYELLPYAYILAGACSLAASWFVHLSPWPGVLVVAGMLAVVGGLVILLRRRDYRTTQSEYTVKSLED